MRRCPIFLLACLLSLSTAHAYFLRLVGRPPAGFDATGDDWTAVDVGWYHVVALRENGTVSEWGARPDATAIPKPADLPGVVKIAAGATHTLALRSDGTVSAWGWNDKGQCNVPAGLRDVVAIAAGWGTSIALRADGTAVAWGDAASALPPAISGLTQVYAGDSAYAVVRSDGTLQVFFPSGTESVPLSPGEVKAVRELSWSSSYSVGCAFLKNDGTVARWSNRAITTVSGLANVQELASGLGTAGIFADGTVFITQNPGATTEFQHVPVRARSIAPGGASSALGVAFLHEKPGWSLSCVEPEERPILQDGLLHRRFAFFKTKAIPFVADQTLRLENTSAAPLDVLGVSVTGSDITALTPFEPRTLQPGQVLEIPLRATVSELGPTKGECVIQTSDPVLPEFRLPLYAHGRPQPGPPGEVILWRPETYIAGSAPVRISTQAEFVDVSVSRHHALMLRGDGTVAAWGRNYVGEASLPEGLANIVQVQAGEFISVALDEDGRLTRWGNEARLNPVGYPDLSVYYGVTDIALTRWVSFDALALTASPSGLALQADGSTLWLASRTLGTPSPPAPSSDDPIVDIDAGGTEFAVRKLSETNLVAVVGAGHGGGDVSPNYTDHYFLTSDGTVTRPFVGSIPDAKAIAATYRSLLVVKSDGTLRQYGRGSTTSEFEPIPGLKGVSAVAGSYLLAAVVAPHFAEWWPAFRSWMASSGVSDWRADPDGNGPNHWEEWCLSMPSGSVGVELWSPIRQSGVTTLSSAWNASAPAPMLLASTDLRTWRPELVFPTPLGSPTEAWQAFSMDVRTPTFGGGWTPPPAEFFILRAP